MDSGDVENIIDEFFQGKYKFEKFIKKSTNLNNNNSSQSNNSLANSCNSAGNIRDSHHSRSSLSQISLHEDLFSLN